MRLVHFTIRYSKSQELFQRKFRFFEGYLQANWTITDSIQSRIGSVEPSPAALVRTTSKRGSSPKPPKQKSHTDNGRMLRDDIGLDEIKESMPSSRHRATVHRTVAFKWVRVLSLVHIKKKTTPNGVVFFLVELGKLNPNRGLHRLPPGKSSAFRP